MGELSLRDWALLYAENGFKIFPLKPGTKVPATKNGVKDATDDCEEIGRLWNKCPDFNIGLPVGMPNKIIGLDIDFKDGARTDIRSRLAHTYTSRTPSGGLHPYYRHPNCNLKNNKKIEAGVTVRSDGYYFVAPPSRLENGGCYTCELPIWKWDLPNCPQWIIDCAELREKPTNQAGWRHDFLLCRAVALRYLGTPPEEIFKKLKELRAIMPKAYEKSDEELLNMCKWAHDKITPDEVAVALQDIGDSCISNTLLLYSKCDQISTFEIVDKEKKLIQLITEEKEYPKRIVMKNFFGTYGEVKNGQQKIPQAIKVWRETTESLAAYPSAIAWPDEDKWCFKKLDFMPVQGEHPTWDEFCGRMKGQDEFKAYIWSIFEEHNRSRQFIYMYGPHGNEGKSAVIRIISALLGRAAVPITNSAVTGDTLRWLPSLLYGKRLVTWADCKNPKFAMSETLRNLTSGDGVAIDQKGKPVFHADMRLKMIIASNEEPQISDEGANTSRLIRVDLDENKRGFDPGWEKALERELPQFLFTCRDYYQLLCPDHGNIMLSPKAIDLIQDSTEIIDSDFDNILNRLDFGENLSCDSGDFADLCKEFNLKPFQVHNLKQILFKNHKVRCVHRAGGGRRKREWLGICIKVRQFFGASIV